MMTRNTEIEIKCSFCRTNKTINDTENCEAVNGALSPCTILALFCLLMNLLVNMLMNLLVNLSPNSFQIVIYDHLCVCMDVW